MRLYLFPITRNRTLIYCKRSVTAAPATSSSSSSSSSPTSPSSPPAPKPPLLDRITTRANQTWQKWESEPRGWKKTVTGWGNQAFSRIPYQEWGLKSIPPLSKQRRAESQQLAREVKRDEKDPERRERRRGVEVDVIIPGKTLDSGRVIEVLKMLSGEKKGEYRRKIWWSVLAMPFTIPFALVPVVPNLPFFYLVFRAWSFWRAKAGCDHVEFLLREDLVNVKPSKLLQRVYDVKTVEGGEMERWKGEVEDLREDGNLGDKDTAVEEVAWKALGRGEGGSEKAADDKNEKLLYGKGFGKVVALATNMPEVEVELERAHDQVAKVLDEDARRSGQEATPHKDKAD